MHELHTPLNFALVSSHHLSLPYLFYVCKHCLLGFRLFQRSTNMVSVGKFRINMLLLNLVQHLFQLLPVCCWKFILLKQTVTFCSLLYLYSTRHWKANCQYFDNQREIVLENIYAACNPWTRRESYKYLLRHIWKQYMANVILKTLSYIIICFIINIRNQWPSWKRTCHDLCSWIKYAMMSGQKLGYRFMYIHGYC